MLNTKCKVMSKTVIKNSKLLVRRVVGDLPVGIAGSVAIVEKNKQGIQCCIDILNTMAPYYKYSQDDISRILHLLSVLYEINSSSYFLVDKLSELHRSLNPEDLGLEVID